MPAVAPHALYTNSDETLHAARALANKYNAPLLIHLSETKHENDETLAKRRMTPTRILDALGMFKGRTLAAHAVWVDDADLAILKQRGVGVAHCPSSNMKLASGVAPVVKMLALDLRWASAPTVRRAATTISICSRRWISPPSCRRLLTNDPQALPATAALEMATIRGARALGLDKEIGSLEAGKRADLITVRLDRPHAAPLYDAVSQMVYALKASDVRDVMVNGKPVVRDAKILTPQSSNWCCRRPRSIARKSLHP